VGVNVPNDTLYKRMQVCYCIRNDVIMFAVIRMRSGPTHLDDVCLREIQKIYNKHFSPPLRGDKFVEWWL
jgi:hypothetical protein